MAFFMIDCETVIEGAEDEMLRRSLVVTVLEFEVLSVQINSLPDTTQLLPTPSFNVALFPASSFNPTTFMENVWGFPSHNKPSQGVTSISLSFKSKAWMPTIGLQNAGTMPPVNITGNGHTTPVICPSRNTWTSLKEEFPRRREELVLIFEVGLTKVVDADERTFCHQNSSLPCPVAAMERIARLALRGMWLLSRVVLAFVFSGEEMVNAEGRDALRPRLRERGRMVDAGVRA